MNLRYHKLSDFAPFTRTSSILVAEVGEPPDVAQTHGIAHHGQNELQLVSPYRPLANSAFLLLMK